MGLGSIFPLVYTAKKKNCKHLYANCACGVKCAGQLLWPMSVPKNCEVAELVFKMSFYFLPLKQKGEAVGGASTPASSFCPRKVMLLGMSISKAPFPGMSWGL